MTSYHYDNGFGNECKIIGKSLRVMALSLRRIRAHARWREPSMAQIQFSDAHCSRVLTCVKIMAMNECGKKNRKSAFMIFVKLACSSMCSGPSSPDKNNCCSWWQLQLLGWRSPHDWSLLLTPPFPIVSIVSWAPGHAGCFSWSLKEDGGGEVVASNCFETLSSEHPFSSSSPHDSSSCSLSNGALKPLYGNRARMHINAELQQHLRPHPSSHSSKCCLTMHP